MAIQVHIKGIEKVNKFFRVFPNNLSKEINNQMYEFMKRVATNAKMRAPRWTGKLARSISIKREKKNIVVLVVDSPYGIFQETGYRPHYVELRRSTRVGGVVADWAATKGVKGQTGSIFVSKFKPFIGPALSREIQILPQRLNLAINKAKKRS